MCKNSVLLRDIITKYHPVWKKYPDIHSFMINSPRSFNVEHLIEVCLAHVGGYNFVDEAGYDFDDPVWSDSKTLSVNVKSYRAELGNLANKIGALRITIYNPHSDKVDFMYMTFDEWNEYKRSCYGKNQEDKTRLVMSWNKKDHYNQFEKFRLKSFKELARCQRTQPL